MSHQMDTDNTHGTSSTAEPNPKTRAMPAGIMPEEFTMALRNLAATQLHQQLLLQQITEKLATLQIPHSATTEPVPTRTSPNINQFKSNSDLPPWATNVLAPLLAYTEEPSESIAPTLADTVWYFLYNYLTLTVDSSSPTQPATPKVRVCQALPGGSK